MRIAQPLGLTPEGDQLIVVTDDGEEIAIPADDRLRASLRPDRPRLGQLEIQMDSALRPRDIQARIRAGESLEEVARAAGVPTERLDAFAAPVMAERDHVAGLAQVHPVRRRGETTSHRTLRNAVADQLAIRGIEPADVTWDSWKLEDRRWQVKATYRSGSAEHEALFVYEQMGRFSTAANDEARWLIGDSNPLHGPQPGRRQPHSPGDAPFADDELALVRALQTAVEGDEAQEVVEAGTAAASEGDGESGYTEDAYAEGELAEVDGVYDIVQSRSDMDVLYDMLSSFDEDSVKIYAGLIHPDQLDAVPPTDDPAEPQDVAEPQPEGVAESEGVAEAEARDEETEPAAEPTVPLAPMEPEQPKLVEDGTPAPTPPRPARRPGKRRASVPSWDEIVFGGPTPAKDD